MASGVRLGIEPINRFETYFINRGDQAMALAEAGNFEQAIALQERMLAQRRAAGQEHEVDRASGWLETYRRGQAVRSPWRD